MERIKALINKLREQIDEQADAGRLKITAQQLLAELQQLEMAQAHIPASSKVAVVMPANIHFNGHVAEPNLPPKNETAIPEKKQDKKYQPHLPSLFEGDAEVPTLSRNGSDDKRELHEVLAANTESLNDKLKEEKTEIASRLSDTPIKDLRKAISLNDKFLFIKELFRGDEAMYERSLKTVNSFHILSEAMYWIERELKIKLGWDEDAEPVQVFMNLVKRRYA